ncbi:MAG: hypothetical protein J2P30_00005 [Actinobacteria bacterium]|nr:hypothetical protein [Actinomycetota bacterium]
MSKASEVRKIVRAAESQGFRVRQTSRGHYLFWTKTGEFICDLSGTPGSDREIVNKLTQLRKKGLRY